MIYEKGWLNFWWQKQREFDAAEIALFNVTEPCVSHDPHRFTWILFSLSLKRKRKQRRDRSIVKAVVRGLVVTILPSSGYGFYDLLLGLLRVVSCLHDFSRRAPPAVCFHCTRISCSQPSKFSTYKLEIDVLYAGSSYQVHEVTRILKRTRSNETRRKVFWYRGPF